MEIFRLKRVLEKINEECKLSDNLNITINSKSNINNETNTTQILVGPPVVAEGSYKIGSVRPFVRLSGHFFELYH